MVTSGAGSFHCESISFEPSADSDGYDTLYFGPWYQRESQLVELGGTGKSILRNRCVPLKDGIEIDAKWKTVRAFSIIVLLVGAFQCFALFYAPCYGSFSASRWTCMAVFTTIFMTLMQGLFFLLFAEGSACDEFTPLYGRSGNSDEIDATISEVYPNRCEWGSGSTASAISTGLWFITGILMFALGAPKREVPPPPETQEVTYERMRNPDGTYTVGEVNVIKGAAVPPETAAPAKTDLD